MRRAGWSCSLARMSARLGLRIDVVQLAGHRERVDRGGALGAAVRSGEGPVRPSDGDAAQGALGGVVRHADAAILEEAGQRAPSLETVGDGFSEFALGRQLRALHDGGEIVGTVQLLTAMPPNQPHRCEVAKMIVHPSARRLGIGRCLIARAIEHAEELGKTLVTLDTRTGDAAEPLYASVGFEVAGIIPDFAWDPDGRARHSTTYMFRRI